MSEELLQRLAKDGSGDQIKGYLQQIRTNIQENSDQNPDDTINYLLSRRDDKKYSLLHNTLFARNLTCLEALLELGIDVNLKCHGTPPIHIALSIAALPDGYEFGLSALKLLLDHPNINMSVKNCFIRLKLNI